MLHGDLFKDTGKLRDFSAARVPETILGRDAPVPMGIIFHSLRLAPFLGELVPFIHEMKPLQVVFR